VYREILFKLPTFIILARLLRKPNLNIWQKMTWEKVIFFIMWTLYRTISAHFLQHKIKGIHNLLKSLDLNFWHQGCTPLISTKKTGGQTMKTIIITIAIILMVPAFCLAGMTTVTPNGLGGYQIHDWQNGNMTTVTPNGLGGYNIMTWGNQIQRQPAQIPGPCQFQPIIPQSPQVIILPPIQKQHRIGDYKSYLNR